MLRHSNFSPSIITLLFITKLPHVFLQQRPATVASASSHIVPFRIHNGVPSSLPPESPSMTMSALYPPPNTASATTTTGSYLLPRYPPSVLEQILVCLFESLLPASSLSTLDEYVFKVSSGLEPTVSLVQKVQNRTCVYDFHTWMSAWNIFLQAMIYFGISSVSPDLPANTQSLHGMPTTSYLDTTWLMITHCLGVEKTNASLVNF